MDPLEKIIKIVQIDPDDRTPEDIIQLMKLTKDVQFFREYIDQGKFDVQKRCCQNMVYEEYPSGIVVFNIGTIGLKFYVILEGEVGVYIRRQKGNADQLQQQDSSSHKAKNGLQKITRMLKAKNYKLDTVQEVDTAENKNEVKQQQSNIATETATDTKTSTTTLALRNTFVRQLKSQEQKPFQRRSLARQNTIQDLDPDLFCVNILKAGQQFGELALMNDKPRLATIVCKKPCKFAVINKFNFQKILKEQEELKMMKVLKLYSSIPLFENFSLFLLKQIHCISFRVKYIRNQKVFLYDEDPEAMYIVSQGEFLLYLKLEQTKKTEQEEDDDDDEEEEEEVFYSNKNAISQQNSKQRNQQSHQLQTYQISSNFVQGTDIKMGLVMPYQLIGEDDAFDGCKHTYNAVCWSGEGELIRIKIKDFKQRILNDESAQKYLARNVPLKRAQIEKQIQQTKKTLMDNIQFIAQQRDVKDKSKKPEGKIDVPISQEVKENKRKVQEFQSQPLVKISKPSLNSNKDSFLQEQSWQQSQSQSELKCGSMISFKGNPVSRSFNSISVIPDEQGINENSNIVKKQTQIEDKNELSARKKRIFTREDDEKKEDDEDGMMQKKTDKSTNNNQPQLQTKAILGNFNKKSTQYPTQPRITLTEGAEYPSFDDTTTRQSSTQSQLKDYLTNVGDPLLNSFFKPTKEGQNALLATHQPAMKQQPFFQGYFNIPQDISRKKKMKEKIHLTQKSASSLQQQPTQTPQQQQQHPTLPSEISLNQLNNPPQIYIHGVKNNENYEVGVQQNKSMQYLPSPQSYSIHRSIKSNTNHDFGPMELLHMTKEELETAWNPNDNQNNSNIKGDTRAENMRTCLDALHQQQQQIQQSQSARFLELSKPQASLFKYRSIAITSPQRQLESNPFPIKPQNLTNVNTTDITYNFRSRQRPATSRSATSSQLNQNNNYRFAQFYNEQLFKGSSQLKSPQSHRQLKASKEEQDRLAISQLVIDSTHQLSDFRGDIHLTPNKLHQQQYLDPRRNIFSGQDQPFQQQQQQQYQLSFTKRQLSQTHTSYSHRDIHPVIINPNASAIVQNKKYPENQQKTEFFRPKTATYVNHN